MLILLLLPVLLHQHLLLLVIVDLLFVEVLGHLVSHVLFLDLDVLLSDEWLEDEEGVVLI